MSKDTLTREQAVAALSRAAQSLRSDGGENPEYDRALEEVVARFASAEPRAVENRRQSDGLEYATLCDMAPAAIEIAKHFAGPVTTTRSEFLALHALQQAIAQRLLILATNGLSEDL